MNGLQQLSRSPPNIFIFYPHNAPGTFSHKRNFIKTSNHYVQILGKSEYIQHCAQGLDKILAIKNIYLFFSKAIREDAKKALFLMARPLRPNPPPPLELNGRWNVGMLEC